MEQVQVDLAAELSILRQALLLDAQRKSRIIEETLALFIPEDLQRLLDPPG
jgi:hypothetical protein